MIDVGINRMENKKLCGDVEFDVAVERAGYISPGEIGLEMIPRSSSLRTLSDRGKAAPAQLARVSPGHHAF